MAPGSLSVAGSGPRRSEWSASSPIGTSIHAASAMPSRKPAAVRGGDFFRESSQGRSGSGFGRKDTARAMAAVKTEISGLPAIACRPTSAARPRRAPRERTPARAIATIAGR